MIINAPVSIGELIDKISILKIKLKNIKEKEKIFIIKNELKILDNTLRKIKVDKNFTIDV